MQPKFDFSDTLVALIQEISTMEGKLQGISFSYENEVELNSRAAIEAIHYSTKLEGNPLTLKQVTDAISDKKIKGANQRDIKEIINYSKARARVITECIANKILSTKLILELHAILLQGIVRGKLIGHFREAQNVIMDSKSNEIVYLPPEWKDVNGLMKELVSWVNQFLIKQKNPLVASAIFHYAFVTIHPFMDGNGRLARLLSNFLLLSNNYTVMKYAALEKQHEKNRYDYYLSLRKLQANTFYEIPNDINLTKWVEYWLLCLRDTYFEALERIQNAASMENKDSDITHRLKLAIQFFEKHTKLKASEYESIMGIGRTQAVSDLKSLVEFGYIKRVGGGRSTVYQVVKKK